MTWNDNRDDDEWEVIQWLEGFPNWEAMKKEWAEAPRFQRRHALVEELESDPSCVIRAENWLDATDRFPHNNLLTHEQCIDGFVDSIVFKGITYDRTYTEIIYSEGSRHGTH